MLVTVLAMALCLPLIVIHHTYSKKGKGSPYSITERRVPELQLLFARPAVTPAILKRAATNSVAW